MEAHFHTPFQHHVLLGYTHVRLDGNSKFTDARVTFNDPENTCAERGFVIGKFMTFMNDILKGALSKHGSVVPKLQYDSHG